jgi:hypothetical protein
MKSLRITLAFLLVSLSTVALAQSDAKKVFQKLKSLSGSWEGTYEGIPVHVSYRVTSSGKALMHESTSPDRHEDPLTVFYVEGDRLLLTHYCDAGNRPLMEGKLSPDGYTVEFDLLSVADYKTTQLGHMQRVRITMLDDNHHTEDWIFFIEGGKPTVYAHYDLRRSR